VAPLDGYNLSLMFDFVRTNTTVAVTFVLIGTLLGLSNLRLKNDGKFGLPIVCFLAAYLLSGYVGMMAGSATGFETVAVARDDSESRPTRVVSATERWGRAQYFESETAFLGIIGLVLVGISLLVPKVQTLLLELHQAVGRESMTGLENLRLWCGAICFLLLCSLSQTLQIR